MIRSRSAAVSSSVLSGRTFGSKSVMRVPSVTEGVLDFAERGGYPAGTQAPQVPVATPLDQKSLRRHPIDVWTPTAASSIDCSQCRRHVDQRYCRRTYFASAA